MFVTAGMLALAGIGGTAFGAAVAPVFNAITRRGDRKHEAKLNFEQQAWKDKNAALIDIIKKVSEIRQACEADSSWGQQQELSEDIQFARIRTRALWRVP